MKTQFFGDGRGRADGEPSLMWDRMTFRRKATTLPTTMQSAVATRCASSAGEIATAFAEDGVMSMPTRSALIHTRDILRLLMKGAPRKNTGWIESASPDGSDAGEALVGRPGVLLIDEAAQPADCALGIFSAQLAEFALAAHACRVRSTNRKHEIRR